MMSPTVRATGRWLFAVVSMVVFVSPSIAQTGVAGASVTVTAEEIRALLPSRTDAEVRGDLDAASALQAAAEIEKTKARERSIGLKSRIEIKKKEIELVKARVDAADKAKKKTEKLDLEGQKKLEENRLQVLERLLDVASASEEKAEAAISAAEADIRLCQRETELAAKRSAWDAFTAAPPAGEDVAKRSAELQKDLLDTEDRVLSAMRERAEKRSEAAKKEAEVAERIAQTMKAWSESSAS